MRRSSRATLFLLTALVLPSVPVHAGATAPQPPATTPTAAKDAEAKKLFDAGMTLYKEKFFDLAAEKFSQSYVVGGRPSALRNFAQCHRDLKHFAEAYEAYEQLLRLHGPSLKPADKSSVEKALEDLKLLVGRVLFVLQPDGAEVAVDGRPIGTTPISKSIYLQVGVHKLRVSKAGFEPLERDISVVAEQEQRVESMLVAEVTTGRLVVREPEGKVVRVFIDDKDVGPAPWDGELPPGAHVVQLRGDKLASEARAIEVLLRQRVETALVAQATTGRLIIMVTPPSASIRVDGKELTQGRWSGELDPGEHELVLSAPGFEEQRAKVAVERGRVVERQVALAAVKSKDGDTTAVAKPAPKTANYRGLAARVSALYTFPLLSYPRAADLPQLGTTATDDPLLGGALGVRIGYSLDPFTFELVGSFFGNYHHSVVSYAGSNPVNATLYDASWRHTEHLRYVNFGGFAGAGARVTTRDDFVRVTGGLALGVTIQSMNLRREVQDGNSVATKSTDIHSDWASPTLGFDVAIQLGSTPGTRFVVGLEGWLLLDGKQTKNAGAESIMTSAGTVALPTASYVLASGPQFYLGPMLGLQFGH